MRKMKLDEIQACLWHLQNATLMMKDTEFDKLASAIDLVANALNDQLFERLRLAKEVKDAMNELNERSKK